MEGHGHCLKEQLQQNHWYLTRIIQGDQQLLRAGCYRLDAKLGCLAPEELMTRGWRCLGPPTYSRQSLGSFLVQLAPCVCAKAGYEMTVRDNEKDLESCDTSWICWEMQVTHVQHPKLSLFKHHALPSMWSRTLMTSNSCTGDCSRFVVRPCSCSL